MWRNPNTQYILSLSYGKDSIACLKAIEELGWPLDRIIHAEVWATDTIHADLPPMVEFKAKADKIIKERWGIEVEHLCATRNGEKLTYKKIFYHVPKRKEPSRENGDWVGKPKGWPCTVNSWCKKLKYGSYLRIPNHQGELVYQRSQTVPFQKAPLHKERRKILCSILELQLMSLSVLSVTANLGS